MSPAFTGHDLEEKEERVDETGKVGVFVQAFAVFYVEKDLRTDGGVEKHPDEHDPDNGENGWNRKNHRSGDPS